MFDEDSVQFGVSEPIIRNSRELVRLEHFNSEFQGLLRTMKVPEKAREDYDRQFKEKVNSSLSGCLQVLSYHFKQLGQAWELQICLAPSVREVMFERLRSQIVGEYYCSAGQLREYAKVLVEIVSGIELAGDYRDVNLWNVFEGEQRQLLVGELSEFESKRPVSALFGALVDYMSPERRAFQPINRPLEMSWGVGVVLLALATNELPRGMNFKEMNGKWNCLLDLVRTRYGW